MTVEPVTTISGKVSNTSSMARMGNEARSLCTGGNVTVHELHEDGSVSDAVIARANVRSDGSFQTDKISNLATYTSSGMTRLVLRYSGCGMPMFRPVTGLRGQSLSAASTLVGLVSKLESGNRKKLNSIGTQGVLAAIQRLEGLGASDVSSLLSTLSSHAEARQFFQTTFGVDPQEIRNLPPYSVEITLPGTVSEGASNLLEGRFTHWLSNYQAAYEWAIDESTVANGMSPNFALITDKNSQGVRRIRLRVGARDATSGLLDTSKPSLVKAVDVVIENSFPPLSPSLSLAGPAIRNFLSTQVQIDTGALMSNCETFSTFALGVDNPVAPVLASDYGYTCDSAPAQTISLSLPAADGVRTIYMWTRDQAGTVSTLPSTVQVTLDQTAPVLGIPDLPLAIQGGVSRSVSWSAADATSGLQSVELHFAADGVNFSLLSSLTSSSSPFAWSVPTGDHASSRLRIVATDLAGNSASVTTSSFAIDTVPPVLTQSLLASPVTTNSSSVTFGGACEGDQPIVVSGAETGTVSCAGGAWTFTASKSSDGSYAYTFTQSDPAGNQASVGASWVRDTAAPALTWASPSANSRFQSQFVVSGTCETGLNVVFSGSGILNGFSVPCPAGVISQTLFLSDDEGNKDIAMSQTDSAGNTASVMRTVVRDNTGPMLTQTLLPAVSYRNTNSVTFGGACEEAKASS
ncbi:MAG: hypothetical protein HC902_04975 [Calothrix sp. SM1_5_4]|nr:hypothetical protein [Calothrix sp. SM1_5_4]